jgi:hypothetical protein
LRGALEPLWACDSAWAIGRGAVPPSRREGFNPRHLNSGYRHHIAAATAQLPSPAADAVKSSIAAVAQAAPKHGAKGAALLNHAQDAFVNGLQSALLVAAGVLFAAAVIVAIFAPRREEVERAESEQEGRAPRPRARHVSTT